MSGKSTGAYVSLAIGFSLAGSSVIPGKALSDLPVFFATAAGAAIALLFLFPLALTEKRPDKASLIRAIPLLALQAFFGMALFRVLLLAALSRTSAAEVGIATCATPAITAILSAVFLKEKISWKVALGIALAIVGLAVLEAGGMDARSGSTRIEGQRGIGIILALGAAASESVFNTMAKRLPSSMGPRLTSAVVTAMAFAMLATLSLATGERVEAGSLDGARVVALVYQGVFVSALAYIFWYYGVAKVPASTAGVFSGFMPLSGFALSALMLGERPRALGIAGAALAVVGMLLCGAEGRAKRARSAESATQAGLATPSTSDLR